MKSNVGTNNNNGMSSFRVTGETEAVQIKNNERHKTVNAHIVSIGHVDHILSFDDEDELNYIDDDSFVLDHQPKRSISVNATIKKVGHIPHSLSFPESEV